MRSGSPGCCALRSHATASRAPYIPFSLLSFCVAIATIGEQADLRPALLDYLLLAAAYCGTCETGQPPSSAGQLRHGYHRTRRVRREGIVSAATSWRPAAPWTKRRR